MEKIKQHSMPPEFVREELAHNPNTPLESLMALLHYRHAAIRAAVLRHPSLPASVREYWVAMDAWEG